MPYNKDEILKLPVEEKLQLIEDIMESVNDIEDADEDELITLAKERYELHLKNPEAGMSWDAVKKMLWAKYGF